MAKPLLSTRRSRAAHARRTLTRFRPGVDALEGRALLTQIYHVNDGASLSAAVASADTQSGAAEIVLDKPGVYNLSSSLKINVNLTITGQQDDSPNLYVIQPSSGVSDRVMEVTGATQVTIHDVTIQGGSATGNGGAIEVTTTGARLNLEDDVIQNNTASGDGGGVDVADGAGLVVSETSFLNNTAGGDGGGVDFTASSQAATVSINSAVFSGNKALGNNGTSKGDGGGILVQAMPPSGASSSTPPPVVSLSVNRTGFLGNTSQNGGGGLWASDVTNLRASDILASRNTSVQDAGGLGDAVTHLNGASFSFTDSLVTSNQVTGPGTSTTPDAGGVCFDFLPESGTTATGNVTATVAGNAFLNNSVAGAGGGLFVRDEGSQTSFQATISQNGFVGNQATPSNIASDESGAGGGLYVAGSGNTNRLTLGQNLVLDNSAATNGGGLYLRLDSGTATVSNSLFLGNTAGTNGGGVYLTGNTTAGTPGGTVTLSRDVLIANSATADGGGLYVDKTGVANLINDLIVLNTAGTDGGGVFNDGGTLTIRGSTIVRNTAPTDPNVGGSYTNQGGNTIG